MTPEKLAIMLLAEYGAPKALQHAARNAVDANLAGDESKREHWKAVQRVLSMIAPRHGPSELDAYRTAKLLINHHGEQEAARVAWQRACELDGDLAGQAAWSRITDAIAALSSGGPEGRQKVS